MKKILIQFWKIKILRIFVYLILFILSLWTIFAIIPPKKVIKSNPFIVEKGQGPMIAAHQGGINLNPSNTLLAFDYAYDNYNIDILELDLCMTKDNYLVAIHDLSINDTSDVEEVTGSDEEYYVLEHTLEELSQFNYGAKFVDKNGDLPYKNIVSINQPNRAEVIKDAKLNIIAIDEIFEEYYKTNLKFIIEIKDRGEIGKKATDILYSLIINNQKYPNSNLINRIVIGTFHDEIESYIKLKYPVLMRGGSVGEVTKFVLTQMFGVNIFDNSSFTCLQIPTSEKAAGVRIELDRKTYINRAHRRNISVQYWTINDEETMRHLIDLGADVIMTDSPDVLYEILKELGYK